MIILRRGQKVKTKCVGIAELLIGAMNGNNQVFNTNFEYKSGSISVLYNGQALHSPEDFTESGTDELTFIYIKPISEEILRVSYEYIVCQ